MALGPHHLQGLKKRWDQMQAQVHAQVGQLLRGFARQVFGPPDPEKPDAFAQLPRDVQRLRGDRWPIGEGDVVILRTRWLWLLAERMRKQQSLPTSWTANETLRALEHVDLTRGAAKGCDRPEAQLRLFDALTEDYAAQTADILRQALGQWLERVTSDVVQAIHAGPADFAAVHANLAAYLNQEVWNLLTGLADHEILTSPSGIRQAP